VSGALVMLLALTIAPWTRRAGITRVLVVGLLAVFGVVGVGTITEFASVSFSSYGDEPTDSDGVEYGALRGLVASLQGQGVTHVYAMHPLLVWKIVFGSREEILARWLDAGRYPAYTRAVDEARRSGAPTALVGYRSRRSRLPLEARRHAELVREWLYVLRDPSPQLLRQLGFLLDAGEPSTQSRDGTARAEHARAGGGV